MKKRMNILKLILGLWVLLLGGMKTTFADDCPSGSCWCPSSGECIDIGAPCTESVNELLPPSKDVLYVFDEGTYFTCESSESETGQGLREPAFVKTPEGHYRCSQNLSPSLPKNSLTRRHIHGKKGTVYMIPADIHFMCAGSLEPQEVGSCSAKVLLMCPSLYHLEDEKPKKERK